MLKSSARRLPCEDTNVDGGGDVPVRPSRRPAPAHPLLPALHGGGVHCRDLPRRWRSLWPAAPWRGAAVHLDTRSHYQPADSDSDSDDGNPPDSNGRRSAFFWGANGAHESVARLIVRVEEKRAGKIPGFMFGNPRTWSGPRRSSTPCTSITSSSQLTKLLQLILGTLRVITSELGQ